jgi:hypothetical protein
MLELNDDRWHNLEGGRRTGFDPRPSLARLKTDRDTAGAWHELWDGLHHQGDVGDASYAAVPHLVAIHRERGIVDWNIYALVATIELARTEPKNPKIPNWLEQDYFRSINELAQIGVTEITKTEDQEVARAILGIVALSKGLRTHAKFLVWYSGDELLEMESRFAGE